MKQNTQRNVEIIEGIIKELEAYCVDAMKQRRTEEGIVLRLSRSDVARRFNRKRVGKDLYGALVSIFSQDRFNYIIKQCTMDEWGIEIMVDYKAMNYTKIELIDIERKKHGC